MFGTTIKKIFKRESKVKQNELTILYGSHSGNSEFIAKEANKYFKNNGIDCASVDLEKYPVQRLSDEKSVLFVISTHGEGDPPDSAWKFFMNLFSEKAPRLEHLKFSVCALGDSSYEHFCKTGKDIDLRLEELGAHRFFERADCDVDFQKAATSWISGTLSTYKGKNGNESIVGVDLPEDSSIVFPAFVKSKLLLNPPTQPETYHIVLAEKEKTFQYRAGDSVSIIPKNSNELVDEIVKFLKVSAGEIINYEAKQFSFKQLLLEKLELTNLSKGLLERYQKLVQNEALQSLLNNKELLHGYLDNCDALDLIIDFPFSGDLNDLVTVFRKIQPRYYSIASALEKHPGEMHLIVKLLQTENKGRVRKGACSSYLNHWLEVGQDINFRLIKNERFRLPKDGSPAILIAVGTGIAPFKAFLEEKETGNFNGDCWLFFGERNRVHNFFYQKEWENWQNSDLLTRFNVAFSRDQDERIYIQHKISEQAAEFYKWLSDGAHIYICGSVKMGKDVKQTIQDVLEKQNTLNGLKSQISWQQLVYENRIHEDVY